MKDPDSLLGSQIEQFRLDRFIARGAMGMVFEAHDQVLDRTVALKLVFKDDEQGPSADEIRKRFIQEAKSAGRLVHPNIVTVHAYGETDEFQYICMEYVEGRTLAEILRTHGAMDLETAYPYFEQILLALEVACRENITHRDIKPANIMITPNEKVKVMDFGIAKDPSLSLTLRGMILGTAHYMSPEQISGWKVDTRSDIFSLGAVFYQVLTGQRPFEGDSTTTIMYKIVNTDPTPPKDLNARLPQGVCSIVKKALAKAPSERYQTPSEMLQDLRSLMLRGSSPEAVEGASGATTEGKTTNQNGAEGPPGLSATPQEALAISKAHPEDGQPRRGLSAVLFQPRPQRVEPQTGRKRAALRIMAIGVVLLLVTAAGAIVVVRVAHLTSGTGYVTLNLQHMGRVLNQFWARVTGRTGTRAPVTEETQVTHIPPPAPVAPHQTAPIPLEGRYAVEGVNPSGTRYRGTVILSQNAGRYIMTWNIANQIFSGTGTLSNNLLTINWLSSSGTTGVVIYTVSADGVLKGVWDEGRAWETLTPVR